MIDPITAFATAQAAIKGVQAAIKMGKDIHAIGAEAMKFFEAKDIVQREASKPKSSFAKSDTAQAFETVIHAKQLQDAENELKQMIKLVETGMKEGAFGLSAGLTYTPAMYADDHEIIELCKVVAKYGGYYAPHHRNTI